MQDVLKAIVTSKSTLLITWIFIEPQPSGQLGILSATDYQNAAAQQGSSFFSVLLTCESVKTPDASSSETSDEARYPELREFPNSSKDGALELDTTNLTPSETAQKIYGHLKKVSPGNAFIPNS
jgi:hypothetical protein